MALRAIGLLREPDIDRVGANIGNPCSCAMKMAPILSDNGNGLPKLAYFKCDGFPFVANLGEDEGYSFGC